MPWEIFEGFDVLHQDHKSSCGLCCVGMAYSIYRTNDFLSEHYLIGQSGQIGTGGRDKYYKAAVDRVGARPTHLAVHFQNLGRSSVGTYGEHIAALAAHLGLQATHHSGTIGEMKQAMRRVREGTRLVIALVSWGHWVLVISRKRRWGRASIYTILDPLGAAVRNTGSTDYDNGIGGSGTFGDNQGSGWWVDITGANPLANKSVGVRVM